MTVPVKLEQVNGHFSASVLGRESIHAEGATRHQAIAAIREEISAAMAREEIVLVDVVLAQAATLSLSDVAGRFAQDDQTWNDIVTGAYEERARLKSQESPE